MVKISIVLVEVVDHSEIKWLEKREEEGMPPQSFKVIAYKKNGDWIFFDWGPKDVGYKELESTPHRREVFESVRKSAFIAV